MNNNYDDNNNLNSDFIKFNKKKKVDSKNVFFKTRINIEYGSI